MAKKKSIKAKVTDVMGLTCVVRKTEMGLFVGYVAVKAGHPLHGAKFGDSRLRRLDVHGGITYAGDRLPWWVPDGSWWLGFDCGHAGDLIPGLTNEGEYRDEEYAKGEVTRLARQLVGILVEMN